jgi:predicted metal-binding membrane protein
MNASTLVTVGIVTSISLLTWLVSIWQYDAMMLSMMTFYRDPAALSIFVVIWTAGMAAMMFPAIVPMILVFNRLITTNNATSNYPGNSNTNGQMANHRNSNDGIGYPEGKRGNKGNIIYRLRNTLRSKPVDITIFVSTYLAIWALTGLVLLVGWSLFIDTVLPPLGRNDSQQQHLVSANTIYGIVLIVAGTYQFSLLKSSSLGYCESPLNFLTRRRQNGRKEALKMGMYYGLYCLGCCWPYFLLMVALGWMNFFWMGLFACIIFAERIWTRGGLWISRVAGIGFITLGILSLTGAISLPSDSMSGSSSSSGSGDGDMMTSMDMSSSSPGPSHHQISTNKLH